MLGCMGFLAASLRHRPSLPLPSLSLPQRAAEAEADGRTSQLEGDLSEARARIRELESGATAHDTVRCALNCKGPFYPSALTPCSLRPLGAAGGGVALSAGALCRPEGSCIAHQRCAQQLEGLAREARDLHGQYTKVVGEVGELRKVR